jgi:hypothetical protein
MPKARFNPERHRSRVRHNPLARSGEAGASASTPASSTPAAGSSAAAAAELSIPLLLKLPLPGTHVEPAPSSSDTHWALSSLSLLLLEKPARRVLLAPQHRLLPRLVRALEHDEPAVRAEASGALRNVCIEAGFAERTKLADKDTYAVLVRQMLAVSHALDGQAAAPQQPRAAPVVPDKPLEEMNRKERRHAAKAAGAGAAAAAAGADGALERMDAADAAQDEEELSPLYAHLTNLCVVLWCILEASSAHLAPLTPHFADVMEVLCATIRRATAASNVQRGEGGAAREAARIRAAEREAGIAAANTLLTLTDAHALAAIALVGVPRRELDEVLNQGKKPNPKRSGPAAGPDVSTSKGKRQLDILGDAVGQILSTLMAGPTRESLQPVSLGLLALGSLRNASNSLPPALRSRIVLSATSQLPPQVRAQAGSMDMSLADFEAEFAIAPLLVTIETLGEEWKAAPAAPPVSAGADAQMEVEGSTETSDAVAPTQTRAEIKSEELVGALQLALEVLAELVGAVGVAHLAASGPDDNDDGWAEEGDDEEMAIDGDAADGMEEDAPAAAGVALPTSADEFSKHPLAKFATGIVPRVMLWMAQPPSSPVSDATQLEAVNSLATRALSVLSNLFHGLAVMAPPPPSEPRPEHASLHASFAAWRSASPAVQQTWCQTFELALAFGAQGDARRTALEACMNVLYALSRCFEGAALPVQPAAFPSCPLAQASSGALEALLAAAAPGAPIGDDALRVSAISTLGPLARGGSVLATDVARIGDALVRVAESLPAPGEAASATTCGPEAVLAALDAAIDTFADETSPWDQLAFVQPALLPRLKKLLPRARAMVSMRPVSRRVADPALTSFLPPQARAIDKRKQPQLRESADGTVDNLKGFVAYREQ